MSLSNEVHTVLPSHGIGDVIMSGCENDADDTQLIIRLSGSFMRCRRAFETLSFELLRS